MNTVFVLNIFEIKVILMFAMNLLYIIELFHFYKVFFACVSIGLCSESAEELSQLDTDEVDVLTDNVELASQVMIITYCRYKWLF